MAEQDVTLQPNESKLVSFEAIPHEAKTYQVSMDGLTGSFRAISFVGGIAYTNIWYEPLAGWETVVSGREIPLNGEIYLAPVGMNWSEISIVLHMALQVTYPDGIKHILSATLYQDMERPPGAGQAVQFEPFIASQEGTYTVKATLSSSGKILASVTFTLVVVAVALPFTFSNLSVQRVRCQSATAWNTLNFGCTITNPTSRSITHTLTPMYRVGTKRGYSDPIARPEFARKITLSPGQSYNYYLAGSQPGRCTILLGFSAGVPYGGCAFLRDENGNDSPQKCV